MPFTHTIGSTVTGFFREDPPGIPFRAQLPKDINAWMSMFESWLYTCERQDLGAQRRAQWRQKHDPGMQNVMHTRFNCRFSDNHRSKEVLQWQVPVGGDTEHLVADSSNRPDCIGRRAGFCGGLMRHVLAVARWLGFGAAFSRRA